jgi:plastocyanin
MRRLLTLLAALALVAAVALPVSGFAAGDSGHAKRSVKKVTVADDFYSPTDLQVTAGRTGKEVKFKWDENNTDSHNVVLKSGPKSLTHKEKKKFKSAVGSVGVRFNPVFKKKGTYKFICTIHPTVMKLSVKVK